MSCACNVFKLLSGDVIIISYDVIDKKATADWLSLRMVRLSSEALNLCFAECLERLLYSKTIINPAEVDVKNLGKKIAQFCGFPSLQKLDEASKLVIVYGDNEGSLKFLPTKYEHKAGFSHCNELAIGGNLRDEDLLEKLHKSFSLSVGSAKWNTAVD